MAVVILRNRAGEHLVSFQHGLAPITRLMARSVPTTFRPLAASTRVSLAFICSLLTTSSRAAVDGGRFTKDLVSAVPIPVDDQWHQVTLIWDGSLRHLYLDNAQVAVDPAPLHPLRDFQSGLYFGASQNLAPASFWSGLIDDIRIYDKALLPMD